jgi:hypothetical protein
LRTIIRKTKKGKKWTKCTAYVADKFADWQLEVLDAINPEGKSEEEKVAGFKTWRKVFIVKVKNKKELSKYLKFGSYVIVNLF